MDLPVLLVVAANCLLAGLVLWLAIVLWRWRCELSRLTDWLQSVNADSSAASAPQRMGLALMVRRSQLIETRLGLARLQLLSHRLSQLLGLVRWLILVGRWYRRS